ncbi:MAG: 30S ribosome-binding factor RbfA [Rhodanobacteraceae bacterium]|nr:30S ribosome-binding factor RbfA [Xanthomonadales bacterium]MCP5478599.1 30S ribosome-binding factor RbfA [Rhodanobacteraceae bacterium]HPF74055.1 30S ribosome-binding factor RbfA [Xanthomonadaceae bacterium]HRY00268.1 30S ribosome-binding factor RbfA [Xanthomonadaceae bacterium]
MTKPFARTDRVAAQLRRELGSLVHEFVRDHGLPSVSVSDVEVSRDLSHAKVYFTALASEQAKTATKQLRELAPELRFRLGRMLRMRHVPELHFHYDESMDRGEHIDALFREIGPIPPAEPEVDDDSDKGASDDDA